MSFLDKLKNKIKTIKDEAVEKIEDISDDIKVSEEVREKRFLICSDCDRLDKKLNMCKECGCLMKMKTWLTIAECPLKKW